MEENRKKVLKVALAAAAVVGGSFFGAAIGAPMLSLAQSEGQAATPNPVDDGDLVPAQGPANPGDEMPAGPHTVGDCTEEPLSDDDEAKVRAAVEDEVPGATIDRIETECDGQGVYEAHLTRSDGTRATAFLNEDFEVTSVHSGHGPGGHGGPGHGPGGPRGPRPDGTRTEPTGSTA